MLIERTKNVAPANLGSSVVPLERLLVIDEVCGLTTLSESTIYRRLRENTFPKPMIISPRRRVWKESVIRRWVEERAA